MVDTIAANVNTTSTLPRFSGRGGTIEASDLSGASPDVDWFRISLTAHQQYLFQATFTAGNSWLMTRRIYAADGTPISAVHEGVPALLFTPETSGTYYYAV